MAGVSYDQLMRVPQVLKTVKKLYGPSTMLQRFYGLGPFNRPSQTIRGRTGVYDTFLGTRSLMPVRSPMSPPGRLNRQPIGQKVITVMRNYEAITIADEEVFRTRPLGGQYSQVDDSGKSYIARQLRYGMDMLENNTEFLASAMLQGGWALVANGEQLYPMPKGTANAAIDVDTLLPAAHTGQLPVGASGANIITTSWADPSTDIITQLMNLDVYHTRVNGNPIRHIWMNGTTFAPLFQNTKLQSVGGSVYRIFDSLTGNELEPGHKYPDSGIRVVFRGLPQHTFHVYNGGCVVGQVAQTFAAQTAEANFTKFIPDNKAFFTPAPGDWCGLVAGSEPIQFSHQEAPKEVIGFGMGRAREIDPPRWDIKYLNNSAPVLFVEHSHYFPTVTF